MDVYSAYTGSTATELAGKQATLVSGTNIKTVNGDSLVGSGDVLLHTGVTQAQYNAIQEKQPGVLYCITDANGITVDDELDIESTNPVENSVITAALNGVTATTELTISDTNSGWKFYCDGDGQEYDFKDTSISKYKAVYLGDLAVTALTGFSFALIYNNSWYYMTPNTDPETSNVGTIKYYVGNSGSWVRLRKNRLDGTFEYYILLDTEKMYFVVYKTLPASITTVSDHKANLSDVPVAQDNSDTNVFVYDNTNGSRVIKNVYGNNGYQFNNYSRKCGMQLYKEYWSGGNGYSYYFPAAGNEIVGGQKSARDSVIINDAASAFNGFTEQITLTLGNQSATDTGYINWDNRYLYETDNPRYEVFPISALTDSAYTYFSNVTLSGTTYYIENPITNFNESIPFNGRYELGTLQNGDGYLCIRGTVTGHNYIIIDKELLTMELASSLTITRTKNLQDTIGNIETLLASI